MKDPRFSSDSFLPSKKPVLLTLTLQLLLNNFLSTARILILLCDMLLHTEALFENFKCLLQCPKKSFISFAKERGDRSKVVCHCRQNHGLNKENQMIFFKKNLLGAFLLRAQAFHFHCLSTRSVVLHIHLRIDQNILSFTIIPLPTPPSLTASWSSRCAQLPPKQQQLYNNYLLSELP